jgi:hypothetical protein
MRATSSTIISSLLVLSERKHTYMVIIVLFISEDVSRYVFSTPMLTERLGIIFLIPRRQPLMRIAEKREAEI